MTGVGWVVLFQQSRFQATPWQDPPSDDTRAATLEQVRAVFQRLARAVGVDGIPTEAGGPFADVYPEDGWDGTSYGDCPAYRVTVGARGALRLERWG